MTGGERIAICLEMREEGRMQLAATIQQKHSDWSEADVAAAVFKRMYQDDFTPEKLAEIADSIRDYHV